MLLSTVIDRCHFTVSGMREGPKRAPIRLLFSNPLFPLPHPSPLLPLSPIFRIFFQVPYPATPLFGTLTKTAGVCTNNSHSGTLILTSIQGEPHVADGRRSLRGWAERSPNDGLINVAKTDAMIPQEFQRFGRIPRTVAHFDYQRIVREAFYQGRKVGHRFRCAMKRKRELQQ